MTNPCKLASARSFLFVPGHRPERFDKALRSGADAVILDLEDAVPAGLKATARSAIADMWDRLAMSPAPVVVRINPPATPAGREDLIFVARLAGLVGVMLPKAQCADDVRQVATAVPNAAIIPLIESALGYMRLNEIAGATGVVRLAIGHIDFLADTGLQCSDGEPELDALRFAVAVATRVSCLASDRWCNGQHRFARPYQVRHTTQRTFWFQRQAVHPSEAGRFHPRCV